MLWVGHNCRICTSELGGDPHSNEAAEHDGILRSGIQHLHSAQKSSEQIRDASGVRFEIAD